MNLEEIKNDVIHTESSARIMELMIEITEQISKQHLLLVKTDDIISKTEIKGNISVLTTLQNICDKRIDAVILAENENERKELLTNRQFRMAAEALLPKETFDKLKELSVMNYKKFKDMKAELKANRQL